MDTEAALGVISVQDGNEMKLILDGKYKLNLQLISAI